MGPLGFGHARVRVRLWDTSFWPWGVLRCKPYTPPRSPPVCGPKCWCCPTQTWDRKRRNIGAHVQFWLTNLRWPHFCFLKCGSHMWHSNEHIPLPAPPPHHAPRQTCLTQVLSSSLKSIISFRCPHFCTFDWVRISWRPDMPLLGWGLGHQPFHPPGKPRKKRWW